ncbi:MAG: ribosomal protein L11 methyltransferase [Paracoccaceae bacterium]|jgi:ribosomal protein L11 methyltransferase
MPTFTAVSTVADQEKANALAEAMEGLTPEPTGVGVTSIENGSGLWEVSGYFIERPDETGLALLGMAFGAQQFAIAELPETDWIAHVKRELAPIVAGQFFLFGSHDADKVPSGVIPLAIDAAMAFGTGHHGTTQGCLIALDRLASQGFVGRNVADIGCGTAVLAMGAAKIWQDALVYASDIDQVAVDTAIANLDDNDLTGKINCVTCPGFEHAALETAAPFDLVFANILKAPLVALAPDMAENVAESGYVILSGILNEQAADVIDAYSETGFQLVKADEIGEWTTLCLQKSD